RRVSRRCPSTVSTSPCSALQRKPSPQPPCTSTPKRRRNPSSLAPAQPQPQHEGVSHLHPQAEGFLPLDGEPALARQRPGVLVGRAHVGHAPAGPLAVGAGTEPDPLPVFPVNDVVAGLPPRPGEV